MTIADRRPPVAGEEPTAIGDRPTANDGNFTRLYVIVIVELVITIIVMTAFTRTFA